jgi:hypothetical protein
MNEQSRVREISPPIDIVLLDDIARKLDDMLQILKMQIPEGYVGPTISGTATTTSRKYKIVLDKRGVRNFEVINDGSVKINLLVNRDRAVPLDVYPGEVKRFSSLFRTWVYVRLWTDSGQSPYRIYYDY